MKIPKRQYNNYLKKYLDHGSSEELLIKNLPDILKLGKDSSSLQAHILRYGSVEAGTQKYQEKNKACGLTKEDHILKHGIEKANKISKSKENTKESFLIRYGDNAEDKWKEYQSKRKQTYKSRRGTYTNLVKNKEWYISFYGEKLGLEKYNSLRQRRNYRNSKKWYVDTYGITLGSEMCKTEKTVSLEKMINLYGVDNGTIRYETWCQKLFKSHGYSKWALNICEEIKISIPDLNYYGNNEYVFYLTNDEIIKYGCKLIKPDIIYNNKVIEFNGDVFHANPSLFDEYDAPHPFNTSTSKEIWKKDELRYKYFKEKHNIEVLVIWERDFKTNPIEQLQKCINFLNYNKV